MGTVSLAAYPLAPDEEYHKILLEMEDFGLCTIIAASTEYPMHILMDNLEPNVATLVDDMVANAIADVLGAELAPTMAKVELSPSYSGAGLRLLSAMLIQGVQPKRFTLDASTWSEEALDALRVAMSSKILEECGGLQ